MRDFRKLQIWKRSVLFARSVHQFTGSLPGHERYALAVQMNSASVSIASNFAEGCGRDTKPDLIRFIHISIGSAFELETQIEICLLNGYLQKDTYNSLVSEVQDIQKMMRAFVMVVRSSS
ncbi:four helix bundle protein [Sediminibacterium goheungense]|uniref:Four helix bundle protein n=1 Tax=Sediminibacterium goheungense TaxID=1086393 RepID=A0A4R6IWZ3_9BACT|nr:four helix bundle protein [Sediminibacterium goheungense]TDO26891.1 four helix bundle protein [Sediminibacterium goheungense]